MSVAYDPALDVSDDPAKDPSERFFVPSSGGGPTLLVYDSFTEASNTQLDLHSPDTDVTGNGWQRVVDGVPGLPSVLAGTGYCQWGGANNGTCYYLETAGDSQYIFETELDIAYSDYEVLALRVVDEQNHFLARMFGGSTDRLQLFEITAGGFTLRGASANGSTDGENLMYVADDGNTISVGVGRDAALVTYAAGSAKDSAFGTFGYRNGASASDNHRMLNAYLMSGTTNPADLP